MNDDYNENSRPQLAAVDSTIPYICEAINVLDISSCTPMIIADFGSAHGRNSFKFSFDWLFIHVTSLWLSRKPCNLSNHCSSLFAQGDELQAFQEQAHLDWNHFLQHRSRELIIGGILTLVIPAVDDQGSNGFDIIREILYQCAQSLLTSQELLEYTLPIYARNYSECINDELFARYNFKRMKSEFGSVAIPFIKQWQDKQLTSYVRSWSDVILRQTLLLNNRSDQDIEQIANQFWNCYDQEITSRLSEYELYRSGSAKKKWFKNNSQLTYTHILGNGFFVNG
ncbi:unnamed protein product [Adineta ricciae]|uniref:Uncharacterized protein n=1 Tax=Adineta ricciae TaxID=249248 RepID=A0A815SAX4_ADIRI|nr:unnamed protein product [Adineta ricciae]